MIKPGNIMRNRVGLFFEKHHEARKFGRQTGRQSGGGSVIGAFSKGNSTLIAFNDNYTKPRSEIAPERYLDDDEEPTWHMCRYDELKKKLHYVLPYDSQSRAIIFYPQALRYSLNTT